MIPIAHTSIRRIAAILGFYICRNSASPLAHYSYFFASHHFLLAMSLPRHLNISILCAVYYRIMPRLFYAFMGAHAFQCLMRVTYIYIATVMMFLAFRHIYAR